MTVKIESSCWLDPDAAELLLVAEVEHHVLRLRELLVRGDENLKAHQLMQCVPYWASTPALDAARSDQEQMVLHAFDPAAYEDYYGTNVHERPFEQQYGCTVAQAMDAIPRFRMLRDWLRTTRPDGARVVDLSGNDGAMAAGLHLDGHHVDVLDLNPDCVTRANARATGGQAYVRDFRDAADHVRDVAVLFETIEHLADPAEGLIAAGRYAPVLWVSTPLGAVERLNLPSWAHVEPKGHLHSFTHHDFRALLEGVGTVEEIALGADNVMVARVTAR